MKFNYLNIILSSFILTTSYILKVKGNEIQDDFLKDTVRAELFTKTDYNVPDIYINMEPESLDELFSQGKAGMGGGGGKPNDGNGKSKDGNRMPKDGNRMPKDGNGIPPDGNNMQNEVTVKEKTERFKVTNATLEFVLNGERKLIDSISISVGGQSSKSFNKLGYNIKCNKGNLFGRKVLRLRSTATDASFLRSKLSCDILNRLGDPSISANYARVFFNGTYSGLFVLLDAYKTSWIKKVFPDDKEVSSFYQCNNLNSNFSENNIKTCINANDDFEGEVKPLEDFIYAINAATSREEVEDIMDVDEFVREWIFEWLTGSWDSSLVEGKNYYMYKQLNGKWIMLPFDFDSTFGHKVQNKKKNASKEAYEIPFDEWYENRYIVDVLAKNDMDTFVKNLQYILDNAFNPDLLFPHINSLKTWLTPYVVEDHTPVNGTYPGYVNKNSVSITAPFSMEEFDSNSEYTDVQDGIGIKKWIQKRYNFACSYYPVTCKSSTTSPEDITTTTTSDISSTITTDSTITSIVETPVTDENCWSEEYGYPCCSNCSVVTEDELGLWGAENGKWCGIPTECQTQYDQCWSNYYGYPCCTKCKVILTDELGQWGAEHGEWCGIDKNQC